MIRFPTIAISLGDPAGVGVEVTLKALQDAALARQARWIMVGDAWLAAETARQLSLAVPPAFNQVHGGAGAAGVAVLDTPALAQMEWSVGKVSAACGRAGLAYVRRAVELCRAQEADAMVTAPLNKEAVSLSGERFTGHTEFIAELCGVAESRMLLVGQRLRIVHVTTHCSLAEATRVTTERILETIRLGREAVQRLGIREPRIAVCGLNPHAGENGLFGHEDEEVIAPAVAAACAEGMNCSGPWPADTLFVQASRGRYDLVVALYHDQGHIPAKLLDFEGTVNVTLGLPIIRTSVDHGTAFDIAGQGCADATNMKSALQLAVQLAQH